MCTEVRLTSKTFGAEVHGFTGPEETGEKTNVIDLQNKCKNKSHIVFMSLTRGCCFASNFVYWFSSFVKMFIAQISIKQSQDTYYLSIPISHINQTENETKL